MMKKSEENSLKKCGNFAQNFPNEVVILGEFSSDFLHHLVSLLEMLLSLIKRRAR